MDEPLGVVSPRAGGARCEGRSALRDRPVGSWVTLGRAKLAPEAGSGRNRRKRRGLANFEASGVTQGVKAGRYWLGGPQANPSVSRNPHRDKN